VRIGGQAREVELGPDGRGSTTLAPGGGYQYYDSFLYRAMFDSGVPAPVFVRIDLEVDRRPR
jgi:hypothetical protein